MPGFYVNNFLDLWKLFFLSLHTSMIDFFSEIYDTIICWVLIFLHTCNGRAPALGEHDEEQRDESKSKVEVVLVFHWSCSQCKLPVLMAVPTEETDMVSIA